MHIECFQFQFEAVSFLGSGTQPDGAHKGIKTMIDSPTHGQRGVWLSGFSDGETIALQKLGLFVA